MALLLHEQRQQAAQRLRQTRLETYAAGLTAAVLQRLLASGHGAFGLLQ